MAPLHRWNLSTLAAAAALCFGLQPHEASALALGRLTVQSALGEPLRAEIDLPQITAAEADTLRAQLGSAQQFRSQGLEFPAALGGLQIQLQRRVGGQAVLQLSTDRAVTEPFLDLVLDAQWQTGGLVRSYTLLLDPPALKRPASSPRRPPLVAPPAPVAPPTARPPVEPAAASAKASGTVTVQPGETAIQIAQRHRPAGISLDQMLLALLQGNPQAFIAGDVNRLKAGASLALPDTATAQAIPSAQARQQLTARSTDFNAYRRELATLAPNAAVAPPGHTATGAVQARMEEKKPLPPSADRLMLSRSGLGEGGAAETRLAQDKQAREAQARVEALSQNIAALNQAQGQAGSPPQAGTPAAPAATPEPPPANPAASAGDAAPAPATPPAPAPAAPPGMAAPAGVPASPPASASDPWSGNPLLPFAAGGLSALLLSYAAFRALQARQARQQARGSFLEASGLSAVAAVADAPPTPVPAPPQAPAPSAALDTPPEPRLDQAMANDSVDPVAEADVYLAYGREQQAEDILNDALRSTPKRTAVHAKLAEIYAMRQDRKALQRVQAEVFQLSKGQGPDWARVVALGQSITPQAAPSSTRTADPAQPLDAAPTEAPAAPQAGPELNSAASTAPPGLPPLAFDFDLAAAPLPSQAARGTPPAAPQDVPPAQEAVAPKAAGDLGKSLLDRVALPSLELAPPAPSAAPAPAPIPTPTPAAVPTAPPTLELAMPVEVDLPPREPETVVSAPEGVALDFTPMALPASAQSPLDAEDSAPALPREARAPLALDLQGLALELDTLGAAPATAPEDATTPEPTPPTRPQTAPPSDRLATKLALAQEFQAIGDLEGTRTLLQEVAAEAQGELQARAQRLLAELG